MKDKYKPAQTGPSLLLFASVHPPFWAQLNPSGQTFFRPEQYVIHECMACFTAAFGEEYSKSPVWNVLVKLFWALIQLFCLWASRVPYFLFVSCQVLYFITYFT